MCPRAIFVLSLFPLAACAHDQRQYSGTPRASAQRVDAACAALQQTPLPTPFRTDVAGGLRAIEAARAAGDSSRARALSAQLADQCTEEADRRRELAPIIQELVRNKERIPPSQRARMDRLLARADYGGAQICAEALLQGNPAGCPEVAGPAPTYQARRSKRIGVIDEEGQVTSGPLPSSEPAGAGPAPVEQPVAPLPSAGEADLHTFKHGEKDLLQPLSQYLFPLIGGALDSHIDFQLGTSWYSPTSGLTTTFVPFSLAAKLAIQDRVELGLNLPFLGFFASGSGGGLSTSTNDTYVGNMVVDIKVKLAGSSEGPYAVSIYFNTYLPTFTGQISLLPFPRSGVTLSNPTRDFALLHMGAATSVGVGPVTIMGGFGFLDLVDGTYRDTTLFLLDLAAAVRAHRMVAPYLGFHLMEGVYPSGGDPGVALSFGLRVLPLSALHIDAGARIGLNDNGRIYNTGGRAQILFAVGYRFWL